jgi:predicted HD phosphohydrolase
MTIRQKTTSLAKAVFPYVAVLVLAQSVPAENHSGVVVPPYHDKYSAFVTQLEAGQTSINYTEFRESFLQSEQVKACQ